jgi:tetratricopeptide (TPR) repeat protein
VNALKGQAEELRQKEANLERDLKVERKVANDVVAGQRKQMEKLEKALEEKALELKGANQQIAGLKQELEEVRESFAELREERDLLLQERDQMAALLKLNDGGRIEPLIEQNMGLAKQLREANEKVERLNLDSNAAKDDLVDAKRDLAIAKSMINRLQHDNREQDKRIEELKKMLESEEKALAGGEVKADPAEVEMLREVILKQLRMQERRRQAKELLVEAARDLGKEDERLNDAIELFDIGEIELTPDEQKLVANQHVDGEFVSPVLKDRETVGRATNELNREIDSYDRAARKAYLAGRLMPTRELYELVLEEHPGHVPALCKLGVVHLKLNEPSEAAMSFQKAIELDEGNVYAMRMLGYAYMKMDDMTSADTYLRKAVDLAPDDSKGHLMLGMVAFRMGQMDDAEGHFKGAITADPLSSDAYFNLAMVYARKGKMNEARKAYSDALERGAIPDQALEKQIK